MRIDSAKHVVEIGIGIEINSAACHHDADQNGSGAATFFTAKEEPVLAPCGDGLEGLLAETVTDREVPVFGIFCEGFPVIEAVVDGAVEA